MSLDDHFDDRLLADLAAAADGSLDPVRMEEIEALAEADPEVAAALERQRRAVALIRGAGAEVRASLPLREALERERARPPRPRRRWLPLALGGLVAAAIAFAVVLAASAGPTVEDAAAFSERPPSAPAPAGAGTDLRLAQDGIAFPTWSAQGWRAIGSHRGEVGGRAATTVYYAKREREIAYTIVGGEPLDVPSEGVGVDAAGTPVQLLDVGGRTVATWRQDGRTCVLSGEGADGAALARLVGNSIVY